MSKIRTVGGQELDALLQIPGPIAVDFYQATCPPCLALEPRLVKVAQRYQALPIYRVDIDRDLAVAKRFGVKSLPTILLLRGGREIGRLDGLITEQDLAAAFDGALTRDHARPESRGGEAARPNEDHSQRERLLRLLSAATFLIFFQAYMVAPLLPRLSAVFGVSVQSMGLVVPAYLIPYGISTLFYGLLSDRLGRRRILLGSLIAFIVLTALTATSGSSSQMVTWRLLTGLGASGVVPLSLTLTADLFTYEERGRPLGWLFGAMAGGAAFGSTVGVVLEPFIGWRVLFLGVAGLAAAILALLLPQGALPDARGAGSLSLQAVLAGYRSLLAGGRGLRTYGYVFWNGIFHSGVFTWLGLYFAERYRLGEVGIGLALLGYGIPGFLLGPLIGRAVDRWGRRWLLPVGLGVSAAAAILLMLDLPLLAAALSVTVLSLGYDMTQPLLAGIVTSLGGKQRAGQAIGLNVFALFTGFGIGSYLFGEALRLGVGTALGIFSAVQLVVTLAAVPLFRSETRAGGGGNG